MITVSAVSSMIRLKGFPAMLDIATNSHDLCCPT